MSSETTAPPTSTSELAWRPEIADYIDAYGVRARHRGGYAKLAALAAIVLAVAAAGAATDNLALLSGGLAGFGALALMVGVVRPLSVRLLWRRNPALRAEVRARVDAVEGITLTSHTTGQYPWPSVDSYLETDRIFVVQLTGYHSLPFFILAKRGATAPGQVDDVRRHLAAATAGRVKVR